jgi:hypothetical protein
LCYPWLNLKSKVGPIALSVHTSTGELSAMSGTNTKVTEWLGKYGLDQYAQTFAENAIEYAALPELTENDLENLGISLVRPLKR